MADAYEQNLAQKTDLTISDYVRVVGTDNNSYKQPMADVAQKIVENYAGSTLAGSAQSVKSAIDGLKTTATADKAELASDISTVASNLATETSTRTSQDANLQAQINQLVAPTGTAPNPAEIENARIGADNVTYTTLGDAIRTQVSDLKNDIDYMANRKAVDINTFGYYLESGGSITTAPYARSVFVPLDEGEKYLFEAHGDFNCFIVSVCNSTDTGTPCTRLYDKGSGNWNDASYEYTNADGYKYALILVGVYVVPDYTPAFNCTFTYTEYLNSNANFLVNGIPVALFEDIPDIEKLHVEDLAENSDLNDISESGIYVWGGGENISNTPSGMENTAGLLIDMHTSIYRKYQMCIHPVTKELYIRSAWPDWTEWVKPLYKSDIESVIFQSKKIAVKYTSGTGVDSSTEHFDVYVPKNGKYIHYVVAHTVNDTDRVDIWRVAYAYIASADFTDETALTTTGEWEMAIQLLGKDDFIGGFMHGDEAMTSVTFFANGVAWDKTVFETMRYVDSFSFIQQSNMYDPAPPYTTTKVAEHRSIHTFDINNEHQLVISQTVDWTMNLSFVTSYMAMFPVSKAISTKFYTDADYRLSDTPIYLTIASAKEIALNDPTSSASALFGVSEYPSYDNGNKLLISDNGGAAYNKCYFVIGDSGMTDSNNAWKSRAYYDFNFNKVS